MDRIKIFLDTEFTGLHQKTTLISIGLISETGEKFYAELFDYDESQVTPWIRSNVINNLYLNKNDEPWTTIDDTKGLITHYGDLVSLKTELTEWFKKFGLVEIWSDCLAYDWVLFINIFGNAFSIPSNIYYIPFDICTTFKERGLDPDINREQFAETIETEDLQFKKHNALWDAFIIKECYKKLKK